MVRVSEIQRNATTIKLRIEGRLVGYAVTEVYQLCQLYLQDKLIVSLDLTTVYFADEKGVEVLSQLHNQKVQLVGCSLFLSEVLNTKFLINQER